MICLHGPNKYHHHTMLEGTKQIPTHVVGPLRFNNVGIYQLQGSNEKGHTDASLDVLGCYASDYALG